MVTSLGVRELQFTHCELLLIEAGSLSMGTVWEPKIRGMSTTEAITRQRLLEAVTDWGY
jgi:hypothetical protein